MNERAIYAIISILSIALGVIVAKFVRKYQREACFDIARQVAKEAQKRAKTERKEKTLARFYEVMCHIPFAGSYLRMTERMYTMICPYDSTYLIRLSAKTAMTVAQVSLLFIAGVFLLSFFVSGGITMHSIGCAILGVYISGKEVLQYELVKAETRMVADLIKYIEEVKNNYRHCHNIPNAILEASNGLNYEMRRHALEMEGILSAARRKEKVKKYALSSRTNKYLKRLIVQAYEASERGDIHDRDGESLFSKNMDSLRLDVMRDFLTKEKRSFLLSGYAFATLMPIFFMDVLKKVGEEFSIGLSAFYQGAGEVVVLFAFLLTIFSYDLINKAREVNTEWLRIGTKFFYKLAERSSVKKVIEQVEHEPRNFFKKIKGMLSTCGDNTPLGVFMLKMFAVGSVIFTIMLVFLGVIHRQERDELLTKTDNISVIAVTSSAVQKEAIANNILILTSEYKDVYGVSLEELEREFKQRLPLTNEAIITSAVEEIYHRVTAYQNEYIHWYEFLITLILGIACSFIPVFSLWYRYGLVQGGKDNEVRQFQAIIITERLFPDVTISSLLEEMETFAIIFKPSLRECINNFSSGPKEALAKLKKVESAHTGFTQLIDGLLAADRVGIRAAFADMEINRDMFENAKELEDEINLARKRDRTDIVAMIPAAIVLGGYFIIPFVMDSLTEVMEMFRTMEQFQKGI